MNPRELILLSPYRLPGQDSLMLANEDVSCLLNGYTALWHPAAARGAANPPRIASPYDHEQPTAGTIYAVPESPPLILPDDWDQRVIDAGAVAFRCTAERDWTLGNLLDALRRLEQAPQEGESSNPEAPAPQAGDRSEFHAQLPPERVAPFFGIGLGFLMLETLFEAMEHENLLATGDLWQDVQQAIDALRDPDADAFRRHLQSAADRLQAGREVLYPVTIHIVDFAVLEESRLGDPLPAALDKGQPVNVIASASLLEKLGREYPERLSLLREKVQAEQAEVCGGPYREREDGLLPIESQLWNLLRGQAAYQELLGKEVQTFARKRFGAHPQLPMLLNSVGIHRAVLLAFDQSVLPTHRTTVTSWPSLDGKQIEAFTRVPHAVDNPQTWFHLAHYLRQTIMEDHAATLALVHHQGPAAPWYADWLELQRFGPILGQWTTLTRYFSEVMSGEYASAASADEFHSDYLEERTNAQLEQPVSWFARHVRWRRRIDSAWSLAAVHRGLTGAAAPPELESVLTKLETQVEAGDEPGPELADAERQAAELLAERLQARAQPNQPGFLLLNPCSFARRVALELDGVSGPLPIEGPLKAAQFDGSMARLVVEVPAFGFAWIPRTGGTSTPPPAGRMRLADDSCVRNEFFEAEIDPTTGGLRGLRDHRTRINRIAQQMVYNPGSTIKVSAIKTTSTGPALGEITTEGTLVGEQDQVLATFRQRFRAWLGRPVLEMRIEISPQNPPDGYPWHNYYGARFAWRDDRALLLRGVNGTGYITSHTRPETPDYLELRLGRQSTTLFPGGLPFHQRHASRMLDVILVPAGETAQAFDLGLGLDREHPMQTALGMVSPVPVVPTTKGPPHVGATGWLFHLDAPNLAVPSVRPAAAGADAMVFRMLECSSHSGPAELRCVRDPRRAVLLDARGTELLEASVSGDTVLLDVTGNDLVQVRVEFS
jgi:hypothetical protein